VLHLKKITKDYEVQQNGSKIENGVKIYVFVFLLSKAQFQPDFKIISCIRSVFLVSNFCGRNFFREIKMADWFQMAYFLGKKSIFL
jgi:hypothetical protein